MRILLINDHLGDVGGAERSVALTQALLEANGHTVALFGAAAGESAGSFFSRWFSLYYYLKARRILADFCPAVVHANSVSRILSPSVLWAAKQAGIPVVMTIRDPHIFCAKSWGLTKQRELCPKFSLWCLTRCLGEHSGFRAALVYLVKYLKVALHRPLIRHCCALFIAPSQAIRTLLFRNLGVDEQSCFYLPNFIAAVETEAVPREPAGFLFVGRISREKGVDLALRAVAQLVKEPEFNSLSLDVVGDGPALTELKELAVELGISRRVTFHGRLTGRKLSLCYLKAVSILMPSLWLENNPRVALEAFAHGRPVIASRLGGYPDLITDGENGYLFTPGSAAELAERMAQLCRHPAEADRLGANALRLAETEFTPKKHYEGLMAIYALAAHPKESGKTLVPFLTVLIAFLIVALGGYFLYEEYNAPKAALQIEGETYPVSASGEISIYADPILDRLRGAVNAAPKDKRALWDLAKSISALLDAKTPQPPELLVEEFLVLSNILKLDDNDSEALRWLANSTFRRQLYPEAVQYYRRYLAVDPKDTKARTQYGIALVFLGFHKLAIAEFDQALAGSPDNFEALAYKAVALTALDRKEEAQAAADLATAKAPSPEDRARIAAFILMANSKELPQEAASAAPSALPK